MNEMLSLEAAAINQQYLHRIMLGTIAPRPIALASTIDNQGNPNLSPFSFFNAFGVNPGTLIFSPSRRGRDNTTKHTFENLLEVPEVVINVVTFDMVQQMSLSSCEFPKGVNEFTKAGFTAIASESIKPFRVKESPVHYECKVRQIIETGTGAGAGNLIICDILRLHVSKEILDEKGEILHDKLSLVGRLGGDYYVKADATTRFIVPKPSTQNGIGIDALPNAVKFSKYLTGNDLGQLGNLPEFPDKAEIVKYSADPELSKLLESDPGLFFQQIRKTIADGRPFEALCMMLSQYS